MEAEVIRQRLDDIIKNLFKTMIPKYINGHAVYGGYGVNIVSQAYINLDYGFGFEPNGGNTEITHYWSYGEGIPISGRFDTEENFKLFENRVKDDFKRSLVDMCEAINKDDSENRPTNGDLIRRMNNKDEVPPEIAYGDIECCDFWSKARDAKVSRFMCIEYMTDGDFECPVFGVGGTIETAVADLKRRLESCDEA